ncbi:subclass B3 metallo-beta-lactamase [Janthinobacterium sp. RB2R34]|uniref:subclass B3 metallo-beta-lactamase n=1 Tax=Janthinobacterium sp. RB2R34 TaxID=3424193 RepID=UPI003F21A2BD
MPPLLPRVLAVLLAAPLLAQAQNPAPFRLFANTYYVGTQDASSVLITSSEGHVLIDAGLPDSSSTIIANIATLGFRIEDVRMIMNSHGHAEHAGGLAELQRRSDALVYASPSSALDLAAGEVGPDDPQYHAAAKFPPVTDMRLARDGSHYTLGPIKLTAHATAGHTPGGMSWSWQSCEAGRCLEMVYADSLEAVSRPGFKFSASCEYPNVLDDFSHSFALLEKLPCDVLVSAHPQASMLWQRLAASADKGVDAFVDAGACRAYAAAARNALATRLDSEKP